jgi:hypothetical protein
MIGAAGIGLGTKTKYLWCATGSFTGNGLEPRSSTCNAQRAKPLATA